VPTDDDQVLSVLRAFSGTYSNELVSKMARLDALIGRSHWVSVGEYKESILREHLAGKVPRRYEVGRGFVLAVIEGEKVLSRQMDVLVWDSSEHSPFFRDRDFVIIPPEACRAAIEVKSTLNADSLQDSLEKLDSLTPFLKYSRHQKPIHASIFAFDIADNLKFPDAILRKLQAFYAGNSKMALQERLDWSKEHFERWINPWVSDIAVLTKGVVHLVPMMVNDAEVAGYVAYKTKHEDVNDTYGFLERSLLMSLFGRFMRMSNPGAESVLFASYPDLLEMTGFTTVPVLDEKIESIGSMELEKVVELAGLYRK